jgi:hypothetical protein
MVINEGAEQDAFEKIATNYKTISFSLGLPKGRQTGTRTGSQVIMYTGFLVKLTAAENVHRMGPFSTALLGATSRT